jgi:transcriptional regulator with XRE-family HTH domain
MGEVNRRYFQGLLDSKRMSLRDLAKLMQMNHSQLSLTFSGTRKLQLEEAAQLSNIFGEPIQTVIQNAGVQVQAPTGRRASVIGAVGGDGSVAMFGADVIERTSTIDTLPADCCAVQYRTAGTPLDYMDAWVSFFRRPDQVASEAIGRWSICKIRNGPVVVGTLRRGYREGSWNVGGPVQHEDVTLEWAEPILATRH